MLDLYIRCLWFLHFNQNSNYAATFAKPCTEHFIPDFKDLEEVPFTLDESNDALRRKLKDGLHMVMKKTNLNGRSDLTTEGDIVKKDSGTARDVIDPGPTMRSSADDDDLI